MSSPALQQLPRLRASALLAQRALACLEDGVRPLGSLMVAEPSTSAARARGYASPSRMPLPGNFADMFDYRKFMYPDVYEPNLAMMAKQFKTHGTLISRYGPPKPFTKAFLPADPELERRTKQELHRLYAVLLCHRSLSGFSERALKAYAIEAYKAIGEAMAFGDLQRAQPFVSPTMYDRLRGEVLRRPRGTRVDWQLIQEPTLQSVKVVAGEVAHNPVQQGRLRFVQFTVKLPSKQAVAVYDSRNKLLAGDPAKVLDVEDYWVFERPIIKAICVRRTGPQDARWHLIERLSYA